jgi:hypothetical protein
MGDRSPRERTGTERPLRRLFEETLRSLSVMARILASKGRGFEVIIELELLVALRSVALATRSKREPTFALDD